VSRLTAKERSNKHAFNLDNTPRRFQYIEYFESASMMPNTYKCRYANYLSHSECLRCMQGIEEAHLWSLAGTRGLAHLEVANR